MQQSLIFQKLISSIGVFFLIFFILVDAILQTVILLHVPFYFFTLPLKKTSLLDDNL